jgi:NADH dehydrogenase (ubiquinone) 1 alpha subcomplex subunit 9
MCCVCVLLKPFTGKYVVNELGRQGHTVFLPTRGDDMEWRHLKLMGDLGKIQVHYFDPKDKESVVEAMQYSDIVVNCIGKRYETKFILPFLKNYTYYDTNVKVAETIATCAAEAGIEKFVHVSALAADENSVSEWARTKAIGEKRVKDILPSATIVQPAQLFGTEDHWLNTIAWLTRTRLPFLKPYIISGGQQKVQPLWANDAGRAIANACLMNNTSGKTYKLAGPKQYTMKEVVEYVLETLETDVEYRNLPAPIAELIALPFEGLYNPKLVHDMVRLSQQDVILNDVPGTLTIEDLGVKTTEMETEAYNYLLRYRKGGTFEHGTVDNI